MTAVLRAILLDPEARNESPSNDFGNLREPVLGITNLLRNIGYTAPTLGLDPDPVSDFALSSPNGTPTAYRSPGPDDSRSPTVLNILPPGAPLPATSARP